MATPDGAAAKPKTSLFVSYSRKDTAFVDALVKALEALGYDVRIDRSDIRKGEEWWKRIVDLIVDSMLVVFVISPDSVGSPVCRDEVDLTKRLAKRIVPILWHSAAREQIPGGLAERDWVSFSAVDPSGTWHDPALAAGPRFVAALAELEAAIRLDDVLWAEEHARWLKRAVDWDRAGRLEGSLMRAGEITAAQSWANRRPLGAVAIPEVVTAFLDASLAKEERDREELDARERRISQEKQRLVAELARRAREAHRPDTAMRLALAAEPSEEELVRGLTPEPNRRAQLAAAVHAAPAVACLSGHFGTVICAAFSADGARVVTASRDATARVWDAASGAELALLGHNDGVNTAAFSADGTRVVTASDDNTARVWDVQSGAELARLAHNGGVHSAAFSADGARVVTASEDKTARVWEPVSEAGPSATWRELARLGHDDGEISWAFSADFSADGTRVVTRSARTARVWDAASGAELVRLGHDPGAFSSAAFSADGTRVVTAAYDNTARVWDAASGAELALLGHDGQVESAAFSTDGALVVTVSGNTARVWDAASGAELARLGHNDEVRSAAFSADGARVVTASYDKTARVWDAASGAELARLGHDDEVRAAAFSADGARVVTASHDKTARVWNAACGAELARVGHHGLVENAAFSADGARVVTHSNDNTALVWNAASGLDIARLGHDARVFCAAFSADGARVVTASEDKTARVWEPASGAGQSATWRELVRLDHNDGEVWNADFSADGTRVVTRSVTTARVWDAASGVELARLGHGPLSSAAISADGTRVVTASWDATARVWDAASGAEVARLGHDGRVESAAFCTNGTRVVTVSGNTARVWDAQSGTELAHLSHDYVVNSAAFSADGARVVTASQDKAARVWEPASGSGAGATWRESARFDHNGRIRSAAFSTDGARVVTASEDKTARVWDAASGVELARLGHDGGVRSAAFSADGTQVVTASDDKTARVWDVIWTVRLTGERLVRSVARERLKGAGQLTEEERRTLRPILGEADLDVVSRWLAPSPDDVEIEAILAQWRCHREMALALAKKEWAVRAERIRADLAARRAVAAGTSTGVPSSASTRVPANAAEDCSRTPPQLQISNTTAEPIRNTQTAHTSLAANSGHWRAWLTLAALTLVGILAATWRAGLWP